MLPNVFYWAHAENFHNIGCPAALVVQDIIMVFKKQLFKTL